MKTMHLLLSCLFAAPAFSQSKAFEGGIYELEGVMEMASGFRFNADGSFDFYLSYGAMDREGHGQWVQQADTLILHTAPKATADFKLLEASRKAHAGIEIRVSDANKQILAYVMARIATPAGYEVQHADEEGVLRFEAAEASQIELIHQIWTNAPTVVLPEAGQNDFSFSISPTIVEMGFEDLRLRIRGEELVGQHPALEGDESVYRKRE